MINPNQSNEIHSFWIANPSYPRPSRPGLPLSGILRHAKALSAMMMQEFLGI
jgi:hypothetical protein